MTHTHDETGHRDACGAAAINQDRSNYITEALKEAPISQRLARCLPRLAGLLAGLPLPRLSSLQRQELGSLLSSLSPALARHVALGLLRRPGLFSEIAAQAKGEEILERQQRAHNWSSLEKIFLGLAAICRDGYLQEAGLAVREANAIIKRVIAGAEDPLLAPGLDHRGRGLCMIVALMILAEDRKRRGARRPKKEEEGSR